MCVRKEAKNATGEGLERNFFATPWEIIATPWIKISLKKTRHPLEEILNPPPPQSAYSGKDILPLHGFRAEM